MVLNFLLVFGVVLIDQLSKQWVVRFFESVGDSIPIINGVLHLTYITNDGAAFGMLDNCRWLFLIISAVAIAAMPVLLYVYRKSGNLIRFGLCFIAGGGIGNMIDRLFYPGGEVVDFIDFRLIHFAVFNIADSFVTIGCALIFLFFIKCEILPYFRAKKDSV